MKYDLVLWYEARVKARRASSFTRILQETRKEIIWVDLRALFTLRSIRIDGTIVLQRKRKSDMN